MNRFFIIIQIFTVLFLTSCEPKPPLEKEKPVNSPGTKGLYVLNEGLMDLNNSTLLYYDFHSGKITNDIFLQTNGRGLGDTGNDLKVYGSKLYGVVNVSERIEIMDLHSCVSLAQISLKGKLPRKIAFYQGKAYVSCFDGSVVKIDTASMSIEAIAKAGRNPEGVCVANGKLYVANSGGLDNPNYDNTVSVFDLSTFTLIKNIPVIINPYALGVDLEGDVYLVSRGNYASVPYSFQRIDSRTDEVVHQYNFPVLNFTISGHYAYLYYYDFDTEQSWIKVMDVISETIVKENFITDGTVIKTPYCITVNPISQDVYIADAHQFYVNGDVFCFSKEGKKKFSFEVGVNPTALVFLASSQDLLSGR